jgi:quercetin dioxygenase-like cupin family protein
MVRQQAQASDPGISKRYQAGGNMKSSSLAFLLLLGSATAFCASAAAAEYKDGCTIAPEHCKILKEDSKFRVYDYTAKAGDKITMHSHPAHVVYSIEGGKTRFTMPDKSTKELDLKAGEVMINPPTVHAVEHLSDVHVIIVELKQ